MHVLRIVLPDGTRAIDLPRIEGPADASRPLVVIDAGHGGHDPGASGAGTLREKQLTLALALALRDALLADGGCAWRSPASGTASSRSKSVRGSRGGSMPTCSSRSMPTASAADAGGATVYTLSDRGSERSAMRWPGEKTAPTASTGWRWPGVRMWCPRSWSTCRGVRSRSIRLAELLPRWPGVRDRGDCFRPRREAAFVVLKSLDLPSVLVEAGYVSNADDVRSMTAEGRRARFATPLAHAIEIFSPDNAGAVAP
jgi:N-acetylmuramoyl-L-alanine amidase